MNGRSILALLLFSLSSSMAWAGTTSLPEPGVLELIGISAVVGVAVAIRKRRK
jgi:hypothetical protein